MEYIKRKVLTQIYGISASLISLRVKKGYYKTDITGRLIALEDVYACIADPPKLGRKPKRIEKKENKHGE